MLSILIPVYNYDIRKLVKTLHRQAGETGVQFEILVADDCSTKEALKSTNRECRSLPNCELIEFSENRGRTYTRHFLAEKAQYDRLLFLDADVMPKYSDFISRFITVIDGAEVIFGGIVYSETPPGPDKMLRWKYGREREAKPVEKRRQMPYLSIISGAFVIQKALFLRSGLHRQNAYGLDILFVQNLKRKQAVVKHLDNPVVHLGLETNGRFLKKTKLGLQTLVDLENRGAITNDFRPIQKAYRRLGKIGLLCVFENLMNGLHETVEKNLLSAKPSLFWFDLYKLHDYLKLKKR